MKIWPGSFFLGEKKFGQKQGHHPPIFDQNFYCFWNLQEKNLGIFFWIKNFLETIIAAGFSMLKRCVFCYFSPWFLPGVLRYGVPKLRSQIEGCLKLPPILFGGSGPRHPLFGDIFSILGVPKIVDYLAKKWALPAIKGEIFDAVFFSVLLLSNRVFLT